MMILLWIGIGVLMAVALMAGFFARREWLTRGGGTIEASIRLSTMVIGRGWAPGFARFIGDELRWYRMFSLAPRPSRVLVRRGMVVDGRRSPEGAERLVLPDGWVVLRCLAGRGTAGGGTAGRSMIEIAMAQAAVTGFLSWLESAPPGAVSPRLAA